MNFVSINLYCGAGVKHEIGSMFESVPSGDAMFLKVYLLVNHNHFNYTTKMMWVKFLMKCFFLFSFFALQRVLHNWSDEQCIKLLRNCYEKIAKKGKVIVLDCVLPSKTNASADCRAAMELDLYMMVLNQGAKERSFHEFKTIAEAAGFRRVELVYQLDVLLSIIELYNY